MKKLMECVTHYMKTGEHKELNSVQEYKEYQRLSTIMLLTAGGDNIREMATLEMIHAVPIEGKHDWDGKLDNTYIEVKNETMTADGKLAIKGKFNHLTWKSYLKYSKGGIYLQGCYGRDGILIAVLAFKIEHILPILHKALMEKLPNGDEKNKNVTVDISASDFPDYTKTEVVYLKEGVSKSIFPKAMWGTMAMSYANNTKIKGARYLSSKPVYKSNSKSKKNVVEIVGRPKNFNDYKTMVEVAYSVSEFELDDYEDVIHMNDKSVKIDSLVKRYQKISKISKQGK